MFVSIMFPPNLDLVSDSFDEFDVFVSVNCLGLSIYHLLIIPIISRSLAPSNDISPFSMNATINADTHHGIHIYQIDHMYHYYISFAYSHDRQ